MTRIDAADLRVRFGTRTVLAGAGLALGTGEVVLLAGRNGAGKSTLLRCLIGALAADRGAVSLDGRPIAAWPPLERARRLSLVSQNNDVPFDFTGRELVTMGRHPHCGRRGALRAEDHRAIDQALRDVDAEAFADRPVTTLSGGEQRRIAIARALATESPLLLLDEPTSNLDLEHALQLVALLRRQAAAGRGVLVASHDLNLLAAHSDRVVLLHGGRVVVDAEPEVALDEARVAAVFGVRSARSTGFFPRAFEL